MSALGNIEKLILAIAVNDRVVGSSTIIDEETKEAFKNVSKYVKDVLENEPKINASGLNSLVNGLLTFWNESISPDTEKFWRELKQNGIDYKRKEPLRFALNKKRFRCVEQGIDAKKHWPELKKLKEIRDIYSKAEIAQIDNIIAEDEQRRLNVLKKCLNKKAIPQSQYLKFGECMAYMRNCGLWDINFCKEEVDELYSIWTSFRSK